MKVRPKAWGNDATEPGWLGEDMKGSYYILTNVNLKEYRGEWRHGKAWGILVNPGMKFAKYHPPQADNFLAGTELTRQQPGQQVKPFTAKTPLKSDTKQLAANLPEAMMIRRIDQALQRKWEFVDE